MGIDRRLLDLHMALIKIGREVEQLGQYEVAIKIAEICLLMNQQFDPDTADEKADVETISKLLPIVIKRIKARQLVEKTRMD